MGLEPPLLLPNAPLEGGNGKGSLLSISACQAVAREVGHRLQSHSCWINFRFVREIVSRGSFESNSSERNKRSASDVERSFEHYSADRAKTELRSKREGRAASSSCMISK
jgi:hypothetical protein